ncbi:MAG: 2-succinyl-5-enolpyruvyl-6-hydroxy-3-cyclohexene-1-carboxylic-acid synthase [Ignavibacteriaceae bacterium]|nr:2-succinyl-5-enolpyruvyl-6-hydroxy-3-cyclohexene-1-carboxylic-acid synthase [Ignavibacteriaceae bacterium]
MNYNINYFLSVVFTQILKQYDIRNVCISPGSRSTPLTTAFAKDDYFRKFVILDERSSGFFALGLSKRLKEPVIVVTTSGTAVANLHPALVEAANSNLPLIYCTADRPEYLTGKGVNQTINQKNLFSNHTSEFFDCDIPLIDIKFFDKLLKFTTSAFNRFSTHGFSPVHINFRFEKPLEDFSLNCSVDTDFINEIHFLIKKYSGQPKFIFSNIENHKKLIYRLLEGMPNRFAIFTGSDPLTEIEAECIKKLSSQLNAPVFADISSGLRFENSGENILRYPDVILRNEKIRKSLNISKAILFGKNPTSKGAELLFNQSKITTYAVYKGEGLNDPYNKHFIQIPATLEQFCEQVFEILNDIQSKENTANPTQFLEFLTNIDEYIGTKFSNSTNKKNSDEHLIEDEKYFIQYLQYLDESISEFITGYEPLNELTEAGIINKISSNLPVNSNLFISNSLPVRDFDTFAKKLPGSVKVFVNRGASGIDGILSTALGVAAAKKEASVIFTGDLSFFYDLTALHLIKKFNLKVLIIVINNQGGALFDYLPVSQDTEIFEEYFRTPAISNFKSLVKAFGIEYKQANSLTDFPSHLAAFTENSKSVVIEANIKPSFSKQIKDEFHSNISELHLEKNFKPVKNGSDHKPHKSE